MYVINGSFLCRNLTGIERFSWELCKQLDLIVQKNEFEIYIPKNALAFPEFNNIKCIISNKQCNSFPLWDHFIFPSYLRKHDSFSIDFSNVTPIPRPGYVFIHDIYAKLFPQDFISFKDTLRRLYMCCMYKNAIMKGRKVFTVSEFSKKQICENYRISENKVAVIQNGWDHFNSVVPDFTIFNKFPELHKNSFYFTLGSLQKRKNLKWIAQYAEKHPEEIFAISGKAISGMVSSEIKILQDLKNVVLLGYVSDEEVKALMSDCKAFIFPSYYEGFGIPPLEALSVGAKIIVSNAASLPEIYRDCAYYIDPDNSNIDLNILLENPVKSSDEILKYYTYSNAAKKFYAEIKKI